MSRPQEPHGPTVPHGPHPQQPTAQYPPPYPDPQFGPPGYPPPPGHVQPRGYGHPPPQGPRPTARRAPVWPWVAGVAGALAVLLVVVFVLATREDEQPTPPPVASATGAPPPGSAEPAPPPPGGTWGSATTPDGLVLHVAPPEPFHPSEFAAGHDDARAILVTTTVVNDTSRSYEFNALSMGPVATHAGRPASEIIDLEADLGIIPLTTVAPGESFSYRTAYSIGRQQGELRLEYTPELLEDPVVITGTA